MLSPADSRTLERIGRNLTNLRLTTALLGLHVAAKAGFDPSQPRVPAGNPHGGEWTRVGSSRPADTTTESADTSGAGTQRTVVRDESGEESWEAVVTTRRTDGSIAEQNVINRDGSHIRSEFASASDDVSFDSRHTVVGVDGAVLTFENAGPDQRISDGTGDLLAQVSWVPQGPDVEIYRPDLLGPNGVGEDGGIVVPTLMGLGLGLYDWLSSTDDSDKNTVALFSAREYVRGAGEAFALDTVRSLDRDEVDDFCPRYGEVQARTDEAVETVRRRVALDLTPQVFGTAVHLRLKQQIDALNDPDFRAEVSLLKSTADQGDDDLLTPTAHYGQLDTLRVDVLENVGRGTVCVYDIKTGRRKLSLGRSMELAQTVLKRYPKTERIVMMEVRATAP